MPSDCSRDHRSHNRWGGEMHRRCSHALDVVIFRAALSTPRPCAFNDMSYIPLWFRTSLFCPLRESQRVGMGPHRSRHAHRTHTDVSTAGSWLPEDSDETLTVAHQQRGARPTGKGRWRHWSPRMFRSTAEPQSSSFHTTLESATKRQSGW